MDTLQYLELKTAQAPKSTTGQITYKVLKDSKRQAVYFTITGNDGGGLYSKEVIPLQNIQQVLSQVEPGQGIRSKLLMQALVGRSSNTPGFLLLALKQEGLLAPAGDASHLHVMAGDWNAWTLDMLQQDGIPYEPPQPKANPFKAKAAKTTVAESAASGKRRTVKLKREHERASETDAPQTEAEHADTA